MQESIISSETYLSLPSGELIREGLDDIRAGRCTQNALLVAIGAPRLRGLGISPVLSPQFNNPEHALFTLLADEYKRSAHSRYNALIRRLVSFERALALLRRVG